MVPPGAVYRAHPPRGNAGRLGAARRWPASAPGLVAVQATAAVACAVTVFTCSRAACSSGSV